MHNTAYRGQEGDAGYTYAMLYLFTGTDTEKVRAAMGVLIGKVAKGKDVIRISDAHTLHDVESALQGAGMFGQQRVVVLDNVLFNDEMRALVLGKLETMENSDESITIYHGG